MFGPGGSGGHQFWDSVESIRYDGCGSRRFWILGGTDEKQMCTAECPHVHMI